MKTFGRLTAIVLLLGLTGCAAPPINPEPKISLRDLIRQNYNTEYHNREGEFFTKKLSCGTVEYSQDLDGTETYFLVKDGQKFLIKSLDVIAHDPQLKQRPNKQISIGDYSRFPKPFFSLFPWIE